MKDSSSSKPKIHSEEFDEITAEPFTEDDDDSSFDSNNDSHPSNQNDENNESIPKSHPNSLSSNNTILEVVAASTDAETVASPLRVK